MADEKRRKVELEREKKEAVYVVSSLMKLK
jgi:hypothetical protein